MNSLPSKIITNYKLNLIHKLLVLLALFLTTSVYSQCCSNMVEGKCVSCPQGMHFYRNNCIYDIPYCKKYIDGFDCSSCYYGYYLKSNKCIDQLKQMYTKKNFLQLESDEFQDPVLKNVLQFLKDHYDNTFQDLKIIKASVGTLENFKVVPKYYQNRVYRLALSHQGGLINLIVYYKPNEIDKTQNGKFEIELIPGKQSEFYDIQQNEQIVNIQTEIFGDKIRQLVEGKNVTNTTSIVDIYRTIVTSSLNTVLNQYIYKIYYFLPDQGLKVYEHKLKLYYTSRIKKLVLFNQLPAITQNRLNQITNLTIVKQNLRYSELKSIHMVDNGKTKLYIVVYYHPLIGRDSSYSFFVFEINELTGNTFIGDNYLYYKDFNTVDHLQWPVKLLGQLNTYFFLQDLGKSVKIKNQYSQTFAMIKQNVQYTQYIKLSYFRQLQYFSSLKLFFQRKNDTVNNNIVRVIVATNETHHIFQVEYVVSVQRRFVVFAFNNIQRQWEIISLNLIRPNNSTNPDNQLRIYYTNKNRTNCEKDIQNFDENLAHIMKNYVYTDPDYSRDLIIISIIKLTYEARYESNSFKRRQNYLYKIKYLYPQDQIRKDREYIQFRVSLLNKSLQNIVYTCKIYIPQEVFIPMNIYGNLTQAQNNRKTDIITFVMGAGISQLGYVNSNQFQLINANISFERQNYFRAEILFYGKYLLYLQIQTTPNQRSYQIFSNYTSQQRPQAFNMSNNLIVNVRAHQQVVSQQRNAINQALLKQDRIDRTQKDKILGQNKIKQNIRTNAEMNQENSKFSRLDPLYYTINGQEQLKEIQKDVFVEEINDYQQVSQQVSQVGAENNEQANQEMPIHIDTLLQGQEDLQKLENEQMSESTQNQLKEHLLGMSTLQMDDKIIEYNQTIMDFYQLQKKNICTNQGMKQFINSKRQIFRLKSITRNISRRTSVNMIQFSELELELILRQFFIVQKFYDNRFIVKQAQAQDTQTIKSVKLVKYQSLLNVLERYTVQFVYVQNKNATNLKQSNQRTGNVSSQHIASQTKIFAFQIASEYVRNLFFNIRNGSTKNKSRIIQVRKMADINTQQIVNNIKPLIYRAKNYALKRNPLAQLIDMKQPPQLKTRMIIKARIKSLNILPRDQDGIALQFNQNVKGYKDYLVVLLFHQKYKKILVTLSQITGDVMQVQFIQNGFYSYNNQKNPLKKQFAGIDGDKLAELANAKIKSLVQQMRKEYYKEYCQIMDQLNKTTMNNIMLWKYQKVSSTVDIIHFVYEYRNFLVQIGLISGPANSSQFIPYYMQFIQNRRNQESDRDLYVNFRKTQRQLKSKNQIKLVLQFIAQNGFQIRNQFILEVTQQNQGNQILHKIVFMFWNIYAQAQYMTIKVLQNRKNPTNMRILSLNRYENEIANLKNCKQFDYNQFTCIECESGYMRDVQTKICYPIIKNCIAQSDEICVACRPKFLNNRLMCA